MSSNESRSGPFSEADPSRRSVRLVSNSGLYGRISSTRAEMIRICMPSFAIPTLMLVLIGLAGCPKSGESRCWIEIDVVGGLELSWDQDTALACDGFGPSTGDDSIDLYWEKDFDAVRVRADWAIAGETGDHEGFVAIEHQDEKWGSYREVDCTVSLDRNEEMAGAGTVGSKVFEVEITATCTGPLEGFAGGTTSRC
jgi:hypothetical protein